MFLTPHPEGLVLLVRAQPGARRNGIQGERAGMLKVAVTAPPEDGKANQAILELLRDRLDLRRTQIELLSGQTSREKKILIRGVDADQLLAQIEQLLA